ncbi:hypothetical protein BVC80_1637g17 [Macleaya cordata]|uniref:Uncharacterized protein n=1 Tax=Macleaya cordata TaxID=56857 RepID=A0A200Q6Q9_MACCD|nr:hypothetical protein BVC80_1637g17 [Macleaya cordata]
MPQSQIPFYLSPTTIEPPFAAPPSLPEVAREEFHLPLSNRSVPRSVAVRTETYCQLADLSQMLPFKADRR